MKTYIVASTEYRANFPDMFLMNEDGTYYGVSEHSYARWHKFPKDVNFWRVAEGSDAGRRFFVEEVGLTDEQIELFDSTTKKHYEFEIPNFEELPPCRSDYKSLKAYEKAFDEWAERHRVWFNENAVWRLIQEKDNLWVSRAKLFLSFSQGAVDFLMDNDNIKEIYSN